VAISAISETRRNLSGQALNIILILSYIQWTIYLQAEYKVWPFSLEKI
jgi:hypothetical protein